MDEFLATEMNCSLLERSPHSLNRGSGNRRQFSFLFLFPFFFFFFPSEGDRGGSIIKPGMNVSWTGEGDGWRGKKSTTSSFVMRGTSNNMRMRSCALDGLKSPSRDLQGNDFYAIVIQVGF